MRALLALLVGSLGLWAAPPAWSDPVQGDGLTIELPRLQGRVRLGIGAPAPDAFNAGAGGEARLTGASLLGDYYFGGRQATRDGDLSGFRATTGLYVGSRSGLWGGLAGASPGTSLISVDRHSYSLASSAWTGDANDGGSTAVPYLGLGYSGSSLKGGWGFSADFGLMALNPGSALRLGRSFGGGQSLDDLLRDLRLSPVVQLGVSYSF